MRRALGMLLMVILLPASAAAQSLRLRGDALAQAQPPVGLLMLSGQARGEPPTWIAAEAVVWTGVGETDHGDALVALVRLRDPGGRAEGRLGRFVVTSGALRPVHLDGAHARARLPVGFAVEAFGGMPVVPGFGSRSYDWVVGGRVSHALGDTLVTGIGLLHERDRGRRSDEEVGFDVALRPLDEIDVAGRTSFDLIQPGLSEAHVSAAIRLRRLRFELFGQRRSPSRLLPATSIFAALGDIPSDRWGGVVSWSAAPRLDLRGSVSLRRIDEELGAEGRGRATLRLNEAGSGALLFELARVDIQDAAWAGARIGLRWPLLDPVIVSTELELARSDRPQGRGEWWPWALAAVRWNITERWEASAAFETGSSPQYESIVSGLFRLTHRWEMP